MNTESKWQRITPETPPQFPCWLWNAPCNEWHYIQDENDDWFSRGGVPTDGYWHPDQPTAPQGGPEPRHDDILASADPRFTEPQPTPASGTPVDATKTFKGAFPVRAGHCNPDEIVVLVSQFNDKVGQLERELAEAKAGAKGLEGECTQLYARLRGIADAMGDELPNGNILHGITHLRAQLLAAHGVIARLKEQFKELSGFGRSDMGHQAMCDYVTGVAEEALALAPEAYADRLAHEKSGNDALRAFIADQDRRIARLKEDSIEQDMANTALRAERDGLRETLAEIAKQKTTTELTDDEFEDGDFAGAYDKMIESARAALAAIGITRPKETTP